MGSPHAATVATAVGQVIGQLAATRFEEHGTWATGGRLVRRAATWRREWSLRAERFAAVACEAGADLGAVSARWLTIIRERAEALDAVGDFALVHGDLHPGNMLFVEAPGGLVLSGVIDWEMAVIGDPLVECVPALLVPGQTLARVQAGHAAWEVGLAQPGAKERLEIYLATHLLERLAVAADSRLVPDPDRRAEALERVRLLASILDAGVSARVTGIDQRVGVTGLVAPDPVPTMVRRALENASRAMRPSPEGCWGVVGALAAARLGPEWLGVGQRLVADVASDGFARGGVCTGSREGWCRELAERACTDPSGLPTALALVAASFRALELLGHAVGDAVLLGIEAQVEARLALGGPRCEDLAAPLQLTGALIALDAALVVPGDHERWRVQARAAWQELDPGPRPPASLATLLVQPPPLPEGPPAAVPLAVLAALVRLEQADALPFPAGALAAVYGLVD
jgi:hypothetical protein